MSRDVRERNRLSSAAAGVAGRDILTFHAASQLYGLDIESVQEILKRRALTELPRAPAFLLGVVSVRGVVLPVLDLAARLGQRSMLPKQSGRILVVRRQQERFGLLVDGVRDVVSPEAAELEPPPPGLGGKGSFLLGLCRPRGPAARPIILLDLAAVLRFDLPARAPMPAALTQGHAAVGSELAAAGRRGGRSA